MFATRRQHRGTRHHGRAVAGLGKHATLGEHLHTGEQMLALQDAIGNQGVLRVLHIQRYGAGAQPFLRLGSQGPGVMTLQTSLNNAGAAPKLSPDGAFGPATADAVRAFQAHMGLAADCVVGPQTWAALDTASRPETSDTAAQDTHKGSSYDSVLARLHAAQEGLRLLQAKEGVPAAAPSGAASEPRQPSVRKGLFGDEDDDSGSIFDSVVEGVESFVDDPVGFAEQKASDVASAVENFATYTATSVEQTIDAVAGEARKIVDDPVGYAEAKVKQVTTAAASVVSDLAGLPGVLRERYPELMAGLDDALKTLGRPIGLDPEDVARGLDQFLEWLKKALDQSAEQSHTANECQAEGYTEVRVENKSLHVSGARADLALDVASQRFGGHAGQVKPILGPQYFCPDDDESRIRVAALYVVEEVTLPVWDDQSKATPQGSELWNRVLSALSLHESHHVAIDKKAFEPMHLACLGKPKEAALTAIDKVVEKSNADNDVLDSHEGKIQLNSDNTVELVPRI